MTRSPLASHETLERVWFITWFAHRRTEELSETLGVPLAVIASAHRGIIRYAEAAARTLLFLARHRPRVLLVQSPSVVLGLFALSLRPLLRHRVVIDAHNESVEPFLNRAALMRRLVRWQLRKADLVIVTNRQLASVVDAAGGKPFVLPDRVPRPPASTLPPAEVNGQPRSRRQALGGSGDVFTVAVIATYAPDEPVGAILAAAGALGGAYRFCLTGNDRKLRAELRKAAPANVQFMGFLSEEAYWSLLSESDVILDLSLMDNCLVCGAYEAIALGKPVVLTGSAASRELFGEGACYTDNSPESIHAALVEATTDLSARHARAEATRQRLIDSWDRSAEALRKQIETLGSPS
jgi:glycosyltransferase involved in cell wall biosynthesis